MPPRDAPTSDRLRSDIDRGQTGDKVDFPDPAAVPLGVDDEAAGFPPSATERAIAARTEARQPERAPAKPAKGAWRGWVVLVVAVIVLALAIFLLWRT